MYEMNMKITYKQKKQTTFDKLVYGDIFEFTDTRRGQVFIRVNTMKEVNYYCVRLDDGMALYSTPNEVVIPLSGELEVSYKEVEEVDYK